MIKNFSETQNSPINELLNRLEEVDNAIEQIKPLIISVQQQVEQLMLYTSAVGDLLISKNIITEEELKNSVNTAVTEYAVAKSQKMAETEKFRQHIETIALLKSMKHGNA